MKCTECGYNCHERCQPQVPWQCKKRDLPEQPGSGMTKSTMSLPSEVSSFCCWLIYFAICTPRSISIPYVSKIRIKRKKQTATSRLFLSLTSITLFCEQTDASNAKKQLHCGRLYKKGHLLRQWKSRWFVLDTQRNQVSDCVMITLQ